MPLLTSGAPFEMPRCRCRDGDAPNYNITEADAQPVYRELLAANISTLIYSGLADTGVPDVGAERCDALIVEHGHLCSPLLSSDAPSDRRACCRWLPRVAGSSIRHARRKWGAPTDGRFAGHVTEYESGLTFVTVSGAGHLVPADRPVASLAMMGAWLRGEALPAYRGKACKRLWLGRGYGEFC